MVMLIKPIKFKQFKILQCVSLKIQHHDIICYIRSARLSSFIANLLIKKEVKSDENHVVMKRRPYSIYNPLDSPFKTI